MAMASLLIGANSRYHRMKPLMLFLTAVLALAATSLHAQMANKVWRLGVLSPIDFEPIRHNIVDELGRHNLVEGRDFEELASIALRAGLPTICASRLAAERGCLIGYGPNLPKL
jgi:hypothetical protein